MDGTAFLYQTFWSRLQFGFPVVVACALAEHSFRELAVVVPRGSRPSQQAYHRVLEKVSQRESCKS